MSYFVDEKYLTIISPMLDRFQAKNNRLWNCRCPYCLDSQSNSRKARGYFFIGKEDGIVYACHNCNIGDGGIPFGKLLNDIFPKYYTQYKLEKLQKASKLKFNSVPNITPKKYNSIVAKKSSSLVSSLPNSHVAVQYIKSRGITDLTLFEYTEDFAMYTAEMTGNADEYAKLPKEPRIIIPIKSPTGDLWGYQGRSLNASTKMRYITVKVSDNFHKIYGLERYDKTKAGFLFEGAIDSIFLPNSLAMCGSNLDYTVIEDGYIIPKNLIVVFDNEPRNYEIVQRMLKTADAGFRIYIPKKEIATNQKDVNNRILSGTTPKELAYEFIKNSYSGIKAKTIINDWKKV